MKSANFAVNSRMLFRLDAVRGQEANTPSDYFWIDILV
jgi:hypothetical protein